MAHQKPTRDNKPRVHVSVLPVPHVLPQDVSSPGRPLGTDHIPAGGGGGGGSVLIERISRAVLVNIISLPLATHL